MVDKATSDIQLQEACPGLQTWIYRDFAQLDRLPQLPIALLYETEPGFGHWVGILETPEGLEHFDSYGILPDGELKWVPAKYREAFAATSPHVVRLLLEDGRPVNYSSARLQKRDDRVATCGRWVVVRCRNNGLTSSQFATGMRDVARAYGTTPDHVTVAMMPVTPD
jgi:hypothetical protein